MWEAQSGASSRLALPRCRTDNALTQLWFGGSLPHGQVARTCRRARARRGCGAARRGREPGGGTPERTEWSERARADPLWGLGAQRDRERFLMRGRRDACRQRTTITVVPTLTRP